MLVLEPSIPGRNHICRQCCHSFRQQFTHLGEIVCKYGLCLDLRGPAFRGFCRTAVHIILKICLPVEQHGDELNDDDGEEEEDQDDTDGLQVEKLFVHEDLGINSGLEENIIIDAANELQKQLFSSLKHTFKQLSLIIIFRRLKCFINMFFKRL